MHEKTFGYARVSARDQNEDRQFRALLDAGVSERDIFLDKETGTHFGRHAYQAPLTRLRPGDTLVLASLDRLGRHYTMIQEEWRRITLEFSVSIQVLDMPLLSGGTENLTPISCPTWCCKSSPTSPKRERENLRARKRQGVEAARSRGQHLGRPPLAMPAAFPQVYARWYAGELSAKAAMQTLSLKRTSFY